MARADDQPPARVRAGLVGGGQLGTALLALLLDWPDAEVAVVIDPRPTAPAVTRAEACGIPVGRHHLEVFAHSVNLVFEATGQGRVLDELLQAKPPGVEVIGGEGLHFLWNLLQGTLKDRAHLAAVLDINKKIGAMAPTDTLLTSIADEAARLLGVDNAGFRLVEGDDLVLAGVSGTASETMVRPRIKIGESFSGRIVAEGRSLITDSEHFPTMIPEHRTAERRLGYTTYLGVPLKVGDRTIGAFAFRGRRAFTVHDQALAEAFADQAAIALEHARLYREVNQRRRENELILNSAGEGIYGLDVRGQTTFVNPAAARMLGWASADLVGRSLHRIIHHSRSDGTPYPPEACPIYAAFRDGSVHRVEDEVFWRKDGTSFPVEYTSTPIRDEQGVLVGAVVTFRDIAERTRIRDALASSERLLRTIIESEPECVKLVAADGTLLQINRAGLTMLEADTLEQVVGASIYPFVSPEHRDAFRALMEDVFGGATGSLEFTITGMKGTSRWLETHAVPLRNPHGEIIAVLAITRDITERKDLEGQLRQAQKMEAIGRLAGGIAHDFNNLLAVIQGRTELLIRRHGNDQALLKDIELIRATAARASELTKQLLAFSRRQVLQPTVLDLNAVVANLSTMLRRLIGEDVVLHTVTAPALASVRADPVQIEQVIMNLVLNARDAMPRGGELTMETADLELDEAFVRTNPGARTGTYVMLAVTDTGTGMDAETRARIFEPFFTTKELGKGTGLGLSTVYGIVKQSNGYLAVESELGRGTTFRVYLPRVDETIADTSSPPSASESTPYAATVLVVDDEVAVREMAKDMLVELGYAVLQASDGVAALRICQTPAQPIHVLLTDVVMPGMDGLELGMRVRDVRPNMKIIYMSGHVDASTLREGLGDRGMVFVQKPFTLDTLAAKVRAVLPSSARSA